MISLFLTIIITALFVGFLLSTVGMLLDIDYSDTVMLMGAGVLIAINYGIVVLWTLALTGG